MTPEQQGKYNERLIVAFNKTFPIGTKVWYFTTVPFGPIKETTIRGKAWLLKSGHPVCKVLGVSGGVSILHVKPVNESLRPSLTFVP